jgi:hypothetical protein
MHDVMQEGMHILPKINESIDKGKNKNKIGSCAMHKLAHAKYRLKQPIRTAAKDSKQKRIEHSSGQHNRQEGDKKLTVELRMEFLQDNPYLKNIFEKRGKKFKKLKKEYLPD